MPAEQPNSYCGFVSTLNKSNVHAIYHDTQYGFPISSDDELFGRLILEINQAGLSWTTILNKQDNFRVAFDNFTIKKVASYAQEDIDRLLADAGIIRNKLKINAVIYNANAIMTLQQDYGSFKQWLDAQHPKPLQEWVKLFKKTFKFTGGEITKAFLVSCGYLKGAHLSSCEMYQVVEKLNPPWMSR